MKIQYFSDIHLEFGAIGYPDTDADVVIAAGDIGVGIQGARWLQQARCPVIYVAGNHEYYGGDLLNTYARLASVSQGTCIRMLENESVVIGGVRFLGTTLWTDFEGGDPEKMAVAGEHLNDYWQISLQSRHLTPADLFEANWHARHWLRTELAQPFTGKTVVVSHHAPLFGSWYNGRVSNYRAAYCNDMADLMRDASIDVWIHGHVHHSADYIEHGVRVICNPRGYNGHQVVADFDPCKSIEL